MQSDVTLLTILQTLLAYQTLEMALETNTPHLSKVWTLRLSMAFQESTQVLSDCLIDPCVNLHDRVLNALFVVLHNSLRR